MTTGRAPRWYVSNDVNLLGVDPITQLETGQILVPLEPATVLVYTSADFPEGVEEIARRKLPSILPRLGFSSRIFRVGSFVDELAEFERKGPQVLEEGDTFEEEFKAILDANDIAVPEIVNDGFVGLYPAFGGAAFNDEVIF